MNIIDWKYLPIDEKELFLLNHINIDVKFSVSPYIHTDTGDAAILERDQVGHHLDDSLIMIDGEPTTVHRISIDLPDGVISVPTHNIYDIIKEIEQINSNEHSMVIFYLTEYQHPLTLFNPEMDDITLMCNPDVDNEGNSYDSLRYYLLLNT